MNKQPKLMSLSRMKGLLDDQAELLQHHIYINKELAVLYGSADVFKIILAQEPPFTIDDHRLGFVSRGELQANINLVERRIGAGTLVFIGPGSIVTPTKLSADLEIFGMGLSAEFPMPFAPGQLPLAFNGTVRDFQVPADEADLATARHIIDTLWHLVHQPDYNRQTAASLVAAQMHHYDGLYRRQAERRQAVQSREQTIFDRFIYLVNQHCQQERQLGFYAEKMCLTERYLGTAVRQASDVTAKDWIDRAVVLRIKAELRHTDKTVGRISDDMNFPNPSFFNKFFKRLTGTTPLQFRSGGMISAGTAHFK